jgi:hypothetical protein
MSTCPFCSTGISEELSLYGGRCTSCLIEIPGEEAATDPGIAPADSHASVGIGTKGRGVSIGVGIGVLALGGWWMNIDDGGGAGMGQFRRSKLSVPLSAHEDQQYVEAPEPVQVVKPTPKAAPRRPWRSRSAAAAEEPPSQPVAEAAVIPSTGPGLGSAPTDLFSTIGAAPRARGGPKGIVLEDSAKIEDMVARVLTRGRREIEGCFDVAKRNNPRATGGWYVGFTVSTEGKPVGVGVEPLGSANSNIEGCIQSSVSGWRFQRVSEEVQVSDTYRMGG